MSDEAKGNLEKYLQGKPQTDYLEALMEEPDEPEAPQRIHLVSSAREISDDSREHLRRLLLEPGWPVLLQLLDNEIKILEDAAKRTSISEPFSENLKTMWADAAYSQRARTRIVFLAEQEIEKAADKK